MDRSLRGVSPPLAPIVRVGRSGAPFDPPPWAVARHDGTFGNRFDDPRAAAGVPEAARFRCVYGATTAMTAFSESMAHLRIPLDIVAKLDAAVDDDESAAAIVDMVVDRDPSGRRRGIVPITWWSRRQLGVTTLDPGARFVDASSPNAIRYFRSHLATRAVELGYREIDLSTMLNPEIRALTQAASAHVYQLVNEPGYPLFAGIRYTSRLGDDMECWAIYDHRFRHTPGFCPAVTLDTPGFRAAARLLDVSIETGFARHPFLRPHDEP